jgi:3-deoxy-D-manno-octulosonic-acid transferase
VTVFLYECALTILALFALPKMLYQMLVKNKYRTSFIPRLGFRFPKIKKENRRLIWIHAVSVGETKAIARLAQNLLKQADSPILIVSSITETGHEEAKRTIPGAHYHVFLPFDFTLIIQPIIKDCKPDLVILCETDFWFNFLRCSKKFGAKIALVNGKMSAPSAQRFKKYHFLSNPLFSLIDIFCLQSSHYTSRFHELGIPYEKITLTGNLKFDEQPTIMSQQEKKAFREELGIHDDDKVLVLGSTHDPEEKLLLNEIQKLWPLIPHLKVIIVPRHPERFDDVNALLETMQVPFFRFSQKEHNLDAKVILLDAMGMLRKCYQIANAAIVAGSYTAKVGGHNILEPLWYGVPMIYGPYMHSQPGIVDLVQEYNAGKQVPIENLAEELRKILQDHDGVEISRSGRRLIAEIGGSTERTLDIIKERLLT